MIILVLLAWHKGKPSEGFAGKPGKNDLQSRTTLFSATWSRLATTSAPLQSWLCAIVTRFVLDHTPHC
jgi:hypothetical protein